VIPGHGIATGPKQRGELNAEEWTCRECGVVNGHDSNAAINLRKLGTLMSK
jgi:transposase